MSESLNEQIQYGMRCQHGTSLGTPGGADLMCGYCEDGLDVWVDDPRFRLVQITNDGRSIPFLGFEFWLSDLDDDPDRLWGRFVSAWRPFLSVDDETWKSMSEIGMIWTFEQSRSGYWTEGS